MLIVSRLDGDDMMTELCADNRAVASRPAYTHRSRRGLGPCGRPPRGSLCGSGALAQSALC